MKQHEKGSLRTDVPKNADRYWSTADVEYEKAMIRIGGVPTIISKINGGGISASHIVEG
jgi:hypothetical protein